RSAPRLAGAGIAAAAGLARRRRCAVAALRRQPGPAKGDPGMKVALLNPRWRFEHSIYFGCRDPHLPLELGCAKALLEQHGHEVLLLDGHLSDMDDRAMVEAVGAFGAHMVVVTTAPTYLFWRCTQPELRVPRALLAALTETGALRVAVGPHGSVTPLATLRKLGADVVLRGECEEQIALLAESGLPQHIPGAVWWD